MDGSISEATRDRALSFKLFIEQYYEPSNLNRERDARAARRKLLEEKMASLKLSHATKSAMRSELNLRESHYLRLKRAHLHEEDFATLKIIGRGAFGEVRLVRKRDSKEVFAMKVLRKSEMLRKDQIAHVRAERDLLTTVDNPWVVRLFFSFQDADYLYLVMEYLPGGDLMTKLIADDVFPEETARFYVMETMLAIDSIHQMGFIHRDVKPDNLLLDALGHIKLGDFGLATGFMHHHRTSFYKDPGFHSLSESGEWTSLPYHQRVLAWKAKQRSVSYSMVGTPDYIAPEVLVKPNKGYGKESDWWSLGAVLYECLVGYPPFAAEDEGQVYLRIQHHKECLSFPDDCTISFEARDLIERLLEDRSRRLGRNGMAEIAAHPFFKGADWEGVRERRVKAPFLPKLDGPCDAKYFDEYPEMADGAGVPGAQTEGAAGSSGRGVFVGFTWKRFQPKARPKLRELDAAPTEERREETELEALIDAELSNLA